MGHSDLIGGVRHQGTSRFLMMHYSHFSHIPTLTYHRCNLFHKLIYGRVEKEVVGDCWGWSVWKGKVRVEGWDLYLGHMNGHRIKYDSALGK